MLKIDLYLFMMSWAPNAIFYLIFLYELEINRQDRFQQGASGGVMVSKLD